MAPWARTGPGAGSGSDPVPGGTAPCQGRRPRPGGDGAAGQRCVCVWGRVSTRPRRLGRCFRQPQELGGCEPALQGGPARGPGSAARARRSYTTEDLFSGPLLPHPGGIFIDSFKISNRRVKVRMKSVSTPLLRPPSSCCVSRQSFQKFPHVCRYRRAHQAWLAFYTRDSSLHGAPLPLFLQLGDRPPPAPAGLCVLKQPCVPVIFSAANTLFASIRLFLIHAVQTVTMSVQHACMKSLKPTYQKILTSRLVRAKITWIISDIAKFPPEILLILSFPSALGEPACLPSKPVHSSTFVKLTGDRFS